jgi:hypothetical protein
MDVFEFLDVFFLLLIQLIVQLRAELKEVDHHSIEVGEK